MNILLSILFSFATNTNTCEPDADSFTEEYVLTEEPDAPIEASDCNNPLCTYSQDALPPVTKTCSNSCDWIAGSVITCEEWACTPLTPASACRWSCRIP